MGVTKGDKMDRKQKILRKIASLLCLVMLVAMIPVNGSRVVYANTVSTFSSARKSLVCGSQAKIKLPSEYTNCKFSSSNKKVAAVTSKGVVKAVRLGVARITAKSGKKRRTYTITVKPEKASEVWLNQEALLTDQKTQLKLASDKYDTSQVKLEFECAYSEVSRTGKCRGVKDPGWGSLEYSYGSFSKSTRLAVYSPTRIMQEILGNMRTDDPYACEVFAGTTYKIGVSSMIKDGVKLTSKELRKQGISLLLDGKEMPDTAVYTPGRYVLSIVAGDTECKKELQVSYAIKDVLTKKDATGFSPECKEVFDAAFAAVDQIITEGMSDEEKVKAIHDYLIYYADYVNNGDYSTAEKWAHGAGGVLLHREGVCQSYAIAFYMMATAAGVQCEYVTGHATNSVGSTGRHAWNRVQIDGVWYYIDCTWDDPTGGGHECYSYYLSETLWSNHTAENMADLASEGKYMSEHYYLTGHGY